jgi:hypothetical protein
MYAIRWNQTKNKMESRHEQGCEIGDPFDACNFSEENAKRTVAKKNRPVLRAASRRAGSRPRSQALRI